MQICVSGYTFSRILKEHVRAAHCVNTTGQQTSMLKSTGAAAELFALTDVMCRLTDTPGSSAAEGQ